MEHKTAADSIETAAQPNAELKAILEADDATGEMVLAALYPGVEEADVQGEVGWPLRRRPCLGRVEPPTATELRLLREVLDPQRFYLKG